MINADWYIYKCVNICINVDERAHAHARARVCGRVCACVYVHACMHTYVPLPDDYDDENCLLVCGGYH